MLSLWRGVFNCPMLRPRELAGRGTSHAIFWCGREKLMCPALFMVEPCCWDTFAQLGLHFPDSLASRWSHVTSSCPGNEYENALHAISLLRWLGSRGTDISILSFSICWLEVNDPVESSRKS